jgi:mevalonate kinase
MSETYRSNGKLMLTGEYLALQGATTFAVPLVFGQELHIEGVSHSLVYWRTLFKEKIIFHAVFETEHFNVMETSDTEKSNWIKSVFLAIRDQKDDFLQDSGAEATATIDLPMNYGWGSSSSFITNLCKWADVNPFWVNMKVGGGSGYDIACANADQPILFHNIGNLPEFEVVDYNPDYLQNMWFVFQENKMNTANAIRGFRSRLIDKDVITRITEISKEWAKADSLDTIMKLVTEHEELMSKCLKKKSISKQYADFDGVVKSLGAWGGDFMLAVSPMSGAEVISYFEGKGRPTMFNWLEIVKNKST